MRCDKAAVCRGRTNPRPVSVSATCRAVGTCLARPAIRFLRNPGLRKCSLWLTFAPPWADIGASLRGFCLQLNARLGYWSFGFRILQFAFCGSLKTRRGGSSNVWRVDVPGCFAEHHKLRATWGNPATPPGTNVAPKDSESRIQLCAGLPTPHTSFTAGLPASRFPPTFGDLRSVKQRGRETTAVNIFA